MRFVATLCALWLARSDPHLLTLFDFLICFSSVILVVFVVIFVILIVFIWDFVALSSLFYVDWDSDI